MCLLSSLSAVVFWSDYQANSRPQARNVMAINLSHLWRIKKSRYGAFAVTSRRRSSRAIKASRNQGPRMVRERRTDREPCIRELGRSGKESRVFSEDSERKEAMQLLNIAEERLKRTVKELFTGKVPVNIFI